jgi:transposase InsO family protein
MAREDGTHGEKGIRSMQSKGMVKGFPECGLEVDFCEHFIYGKQIQVRFQFGATRANRILELVQSNVFGPVTVPSLGGSLYYVSFINDFSRKTWIYFLRKKQNILKRFKEFKALEENHTKKRIKVLRIDNGGELCGKEFDQFCKQYGIARQNTTPYTPQQNGVSKRMNKTLMDKARSMLSGVGLKQELWVEAIETARYLVNMSPSSTRL